VLMITMLLYALGTAACAFVTEMWQLIIFRIIASLGIGGEWAAGSSMVAEVVPEDQRVEAGALLYTSAPLGLFLATFVNAEVAGDWFAHDPAMSWRYVLLFGLIPAGIAFVVRAFVREPERWAAATANAAPARLREIFAPGIRARTASALIVTLVALITWWTCNAFLQTLANGLAGTEALSRGLDGTATAALKQEWIKLATTCFNWGGLIGTLLTIPIAKYLGRRKLFAIYFTGGALAVMLACGLDIPSETRLYLWFFIGLTVFGVFGCFPFYLPELYPTRLRSTGSGFCYNIGRVITAFGVFAVGTIAQSAKGDPEIILRTLFTIGFVPLVGVLLLHWVIETRGQRMPD
jgi:MFS family permease